MCRTNIVQLPCDTHLCLTNNAPRLTTTPTSTSPLPSLVFLFLRHFYFLYVGGGPCHCLHAGTKQAVCLFGCLPCNFCLLGKRALALLSLLPIETLKANVDTMITASLPPNRAQCQRVSVAFRHSHLGVSIALPVSRLPSALHGTSPRA